MNRVSPPKEKKNKAKRNTVLPARFEWQAISDKCGGGKKTSEHQGFSLFTSLVQAPNLFTFIVTFDADKMRIKFFWSHFHFVNSSVWKKKESI